MRKDLFPGDCYWKDKQWRIEFYNKFVKGWKQRKCIACNGSGYYDNNGNPKCGACNGTGKEKYKNETQI